MNFNEELKTPRGIIRIEFTGTDVSNLHLLLRGLLHLLAGVITEGEEAVRFIGPHLGALAKKMLFRI